MTERTCSFPGCTARHKARGWCALHYYQWRTTGEVKPRKWAAKGGACVVCGDPVPEGSGRRKHCSGACQVRDSRHHGDRPAEATCAFCGQTFSLGRTASGKLQRTDTKWCPDCGRESPDVQRFRRYGVTKQQYDEALARGCEICGATDRKLHIDHDHECCPAHGGRGPATCGECVRGFICGPCNRGLGLFRDDPAALTRAADYLTAAHKRTRGGDRPMP